MECWNKWHKKHGILKLLSWHSRRVELQINEKEDQDNFELTEVNTEYIYKIGFYKYIVAGKSLLAKNIYQRNIGLKCSECMV